MEASGNDIADVRVWFAERGFDVQVTQDEDENGDPFFWAALTRPPSERVVAPMYGRGSTAVEAACSARRRFRTEQ